MLDAARCRCAFTLIELLLALSLTVIVIGLITWSIQIHLMALDERRNQAEEAQLAQAILRRIAGDLQNVVTRETIDLSALDSMMSSPEDLAGALGGGDEGDGSGPDGAPPEAPSEEELADLLGDTGSSATEDLAGAETLPPEPGIFGNQYELQIDVGRTPRIDEYVPEFSGAPGQLHDIPSAVKTVTYYLRTAGTGGAGYAGLTGTPGTQQAGLVRRSLDRAVTEWAAQTSSLALQSQDQVWAPEVAAIEFRYFDGTDWLTEWDSTEQGLPVAVEILLWIQPRVPNRTAARPVASPAGLGGTGAGGTAMAGNFYRLVVRLPQAAAAAEDEAGATEGEPEESGSNGGTAGRGAGGSGSGGAGGSPGGGGR